MLLSRAPVPAPSWAQEEARARFRERGGAVLPPETETLAQLDGGAGIRIGMRLWRRTGCRSLPCQEPPEPAKRQHHRDGLEGNLSPQRASLH